MRTQNIDFPNQQALCVFPSERSELKQAISELRLEENSAVIVLIGGDIDEKHAAAASRAIQTISKIAQDISAIIICGGTEMGVMAEIGRARSQNQYSFPLVGVAPEDVVTWPGGPRSTQLLWWGKKRWQLEPHYTHFILVPGDQFGDESPWILDAATLLSKGSRSVTLLINGGEISRKDIALSLEIDRAVIALSNTGRLADEYARQPDRNKLITVVPANAEQRIIESISKTLSIHPQKLQTQPGP
jgi:SLOG in TRPM, prokaryote